MPETTNYLKHKNSNPIQKALIANFYKTFFEMIKPLNAESILDIGCGEGITLKKLQEKNIGKRNEGIDYSEDAIKIGKDLYPDLGLHQGDVYNLKYKDDEFDLTICTEVLEHLEDPIKAAKEIRRVTKTYAVFSVPNEPFFIMANFLRGKYLKSFGNHPEHINHWTMWGFEKFLKNNGFEIVRTKHPFAWTLILAKKA